MVRLVEREEPGLREAVTQTLLALLVDRDRVTRQLAAASPFAASINDVVARFLAEQTFVVVLILLSVGSQPHREEAT